MSWHYPEQTYLQPFDPSRGHYYNLVRRVRSAASFAWSLVDVADNFYLVLHVIGKKHSSISIPLHNTDVILPFIIPLHDITLVDIPAVLVLEASELHQFDIWRPGDQASTCMPCIRDSLYPTTLSFIPCPKLNLSHASLRPSPVPGLRTTRLEGPVGLASSASCSAVLRACSSLRSLMR